MTMNCLKSIFCGVSLMMASQGCGQAPASDASAPPRQATSEPARQIDSLLLTRHTGYWEGGAQDGRIYRYRVAIARNGSTRFETFAVEVDEVRSFALDPDSVAMLFDAATRLRLDLLPERLIGAPWCTLMELHGHRVTTSSFRGDEVHRVEHDHGCDPRSDESEEQVIAQLRQLQQQVTQVLGLESRFNAAPLVR
jgi:hypothetical protein